MVNFPRLYPSLSQLSPTPRKPTKVTAITTRCDKDLCKVCSSSVRDKDLGIQCEGECGLWFHAACVDISKSEYKFIERLTGNLKYFCTPCTQKPPPGKSVPVSIDQPTDVSNPVSVSCATDPVPTSVSVAVGPDPAPTSESVAANPECSYRIVYGASDPLSNMFSFDFVYNGVPYKSVEQAFMHSRAVSCGNLRIAQRIRNTDNPFSCKQLARSLRKCPAEDIALMRSLLEGKFEQCLQFKNSLVESIGKSILHSTHRSDTFWATGLEHDDEHGHRNGTFPGKNIFGRLLSDLRDNVLSLQTEGINSSVLHSHVSNPTPGSYVSKPISLLNLNVPFPIVNGDPSLFTQTRCFNCFEPGHSYVTCGFKRQIFCRQCGKIGHKKKFCSFFSRRANENSRPENFDCLPQASSDNNNVLYNTTYDFKEPQPFPNADASCFIPQQIPQLQFLPSPPPLMYPGAAPAQNFLSAPSFVNGVFLQ